MSRSNDLTHVAAAWVRERHTSPVASLFFSDMNIDALQDGIRYGVYKKSSKVIDKQSASDLVVTMRSMYLSYAINLPTDVVGQVRELNGKVLEFCIERIIIELDARSQYLKDSSQVGYADTMMPRSACTSIKGHRCLEMFR